MKKLALLIVMACCGCSLSSFEPVRNGFIPIERDSVVICSGCVSTTPVAPADSVIQCSLYWHPGAICWQVVDSVHAQPTVMR